MKKSVYKKFQKIAGKKNCFVNPEELSGYCFDAFAKSNAFPEIVVAPESPECIPEIIMLCNEENLAIVTRGAGTNLSGGTIPFEGTCVLLTTKLNKIKEINKADLYAVVEAGAVTADIANAAANAGLFYPPDPGSMNISTIGGNVAENAGGLRGLKYGVTKDYLMGLTLFDAEANKVIGGGRTVKQVTGFNLPGLFAGSEGLLGIMAEFILKLIPPPESSKSMLVVYDDILKACDTVSQIIAANILPATMELMDNFTIRTVEEATEIGLPVDADALLLLEIDGHHGQVEDEFDKVKSICEKNNGHLKIAEDEDSKNKIWEARRKALSSLARLKPTLILEDATVPRSKISSMMSSIMDISRKYEITIGTFGHAGDGNLHPTILTDKRDKDEMLRVEKAVDDIFSVALSLGGTLSGEHGIGTAKAKYLEMEYGSGTVKFMKNLKRGVDIKNVLNPGKMGL